MSISKRLAEMMGGQMWVESMGITGGTHPTGYKLADLDKHSASMNEKPGSTFYFTIVNKCSLQTFKDKLIQNTQENNNNNSFSKKTILESKTIEDLREIEALDEAIDIYLDTSPELLENINIAVNQTDPLILRNAAHSLKSVSGTLGAMTLYKVCQELEALARLAYESENSLSAEVIEIFSHLKIEYEKVIAALKVEQNK
ncbi:MAG: Hpt domain-containing protein [Trichodesmium sp. St17_bin3_1_1]|nr:Hpt domain-containing protein [Trichodesmium sp. St17_bin3_1_1]